MTTRRRPTQTLQLMLEREAKLGFQDRAVVGGLDGFLRNVLKEGEQAQFFKRIVAALPQEGYAALSIDERERWTADVRAALSPGAAPRSARRPERSGTAENRPDLLGKNSDRSSPNLDKSRTEEDTMHAPNPAGDVPPLRSTTKILSPAMSRFSVASRRSHARPCPRSG